MYKFISRAVVTKNHPFPVRCNCDAVLVADRPGVSITCGNCGTRITPEVVEDTESVSVQDPESGEWKQFHVQGYSGPRSPWMPRVGDKVSHRAHRWRIERLESSDAVIKLLANVKETGIPVDLDHRETVPVSALTYMPD